MTKLENVGPVFEFFEGIFGFLRSQELKRIWIPWVCVILRLNIFQVYCDMRHAHGAYIYKNTPFFEIAKPFLSKNDSSINYKVLSTI